jgi:hypothetical protein
MLKRLSTSVAAVAVAVGILGACVDAKKRFDEYDDRVPVIDASTLDRPTVPISNIDGTWYLSVSAVGTNIHIFATWDIDINGATATLDGSYQPLAAAEDMPGVRRAVGAPLVANDVAVDDTASFSAPLMGKIDGMANPLTGSDLYPESPGTNLLGVIRSADLVCGTVSGAICVGAPCNNDPPPSRIPLTGATFGARRASAANMLPAMLDHCPDPQAIDAGIDAP